MAEKVRCPMCEQEVEVSADGKLSVHDRAPPTRALCGFSGIDLNGPGTSMRCDECLCVLLVGDRDTWRTVEEAVAASHKAGWTGDDAYSLCEKCTADKEADRDDWSSWLRK